MSSDLLGRATFGGLASGLDTNALLSGLLELERIPLNRIKSRRADISNQRSLMRDLNTKLMALREAAQALDNRNENDSAVSSTEEFLKFGASSTDEDIVTVSAGAGAAPGDIDIEVVKLAQGSRAFSYSYESDTTEVLAAGQTMTISLNNGDDTVFPAIEATEITLLAPTESGLNIQDVRDQINTSEENGGTVRADVLRVADGDYQLVLTSTGTGLSNQLTITGDVAIVEPDPVRDVASNAQIRLFGQTGSEADPRLIERESNLIDDVLTGITFQLRRPSAVDEDAYSVGDDPDSPADANDPFQRRNIETVSIEVDIDEVEKGLAEFTKAYNDVIGFIDNQFRYNETSKSSGPLSGDFTLRQVQGELRDMISRAFSFVLNPSNPFASIANGGLGGTISNIGIEIESGGTLSVNREKLEEALALDANSVSEFLSGRLAENPDEVPEGEEPEYDEGFAQLFATQLEQLVRSGDGTLASRDESYAKRLDEFDDSIERFEFRLGQREETLIQRFSELERIVSGLQSQQGFLSSLA